MDEHIPDDEYRRRQDENATILDVAIEGLERKYSAKWHDAMIRSMGHPKTDDAVGFPDLWRDVKEVQLLFNNTKPVDREVREQLWTRYNEFRDRASAAHDAHRAGMENLLDTNRDEVYQALMQLEADYHLDEVDAEEPAARPDVKGFNDSAAEVQALLKERKLRPGDRDALWTGLNHLWSKVKVLREHNQSDWQRRQHDLIGKIEAEIEHDKEYRKSILGRIENAEAFMDRLHAHIVNDEAYIPRLREQIAEMEEQRDSAWSDTFFNQVSFRIDEKLKKIADVEAQILDRQAKLMEVPGQVEGYRLKIELVEKQIEERRERIQDIRSRLTPTV